MEKINYTIRERILLDILHDEIYNGDYDIQTIYSPLEGYECWDAITHRYTKGTTRTIGKPHIYEVKIRTNDVEPMLVKTKLEELLKLKEKIDGKIFYVSCHPLQTLVFDITDYDPDTIKWQKVSMDKSTMYPNMGKIIRDVVYLNPDNARSYNITRRDIDFLDLKNERDNYMTNKIMATEQLFRLFNIVL